MKVCKRSLVDQYGWWRYLGRFGYLIVTLLLFILERGNLQRVWKGTQFGNDMWRLRTKHADTSFISRGYDIGPVSVILGNSIG